MRVEIYKFNEEKILQKANDLGITPTELVNEILDSINIIVKPKIEKINLDFSKAKIEPAPKKNKKTKNGRNWVKDF